MGQGGVEGRGCQNDEKGGKWKRIEGRTSRAKARVQALALGLLPRGQNVGGWVGDDRYRLWGRDAGGVVWFKGDMTFKCRGAAP